jgi:hypothetical protein
MNLIIPTAGSEAGPQYAIDVNNSLTSIDQHDHSTGKGVQIGTSGINIQTAFSLNSNFLTSVAGVTFTTQSSVPSAGQTLYVKTGTESSPLPDLWYNDGTSAPIQLTSGGAVNATIASIPGESYAGGTFTWRQGTGSTTPANFDIGSLTTRPDVASTTYGVTIQPNSGIATSYNFILPASLPSSQSFMTLDNSGNVASGVAYSQGITNAQIAPQTITQGLLALRATGSTVSAGGVASVALSGGPATGAAVALGSVTITTTGRPVMLMLASQASFEGSIGGYRTVTTSGIYTVSFGYYFSPSSGPTFGYSGTNMTLYSSAAGTLSINLPPGSISAITFPTAGTYTYTFYGQGDSAYSSYFQIQNINLIAYEL